MPRAETKFEAAKFPDEIKRFKIVWVQFFIIFIYLLINKINKIILIS
jgi:hypothetical protein